MKRVSLKIVISAKMAFHRSDVTFSARNGGKRAGFMEKNGKYDLIGGQWDKKAFGRKLFVVLSVCVLLVLTLAGCQGDQAFVIDLKDGASLRLEEGERDSRILLENGKNETGEDGECGGQEPVYVHVCGAVNQPGLKVLPAGSRAYDALELAGGFSQEADLSAVNLAAFVEDGQQLYFPTKEEAVSREETSDGKIDLNSADEALLCTLPGIGSSRARAILQYRKEKGRFNEVEELLEIPGIKDNVFNQIRDLVKIN